MYCKDANRQDDYPEHSFDFLGFTFRPRKSMNRSGKLFVSFSPAVSDKATKAMRQVGASLKLSHRDDLVLGMPCRLGRSSSVG